MEHNLKPTKMAIQPGTERKVSPNSKPDQFGQVQSGDKDLTQGNAPSNSDTKLAHMNADTDSSKGAKHHTLGPGRNQAASGMHTHDGTDSQKLGFYEMDPGNPGKTRPSLVLTGSKGGNAALTNLIALLKNFIDFQDTTT